MKLYFWVKLSRVTGKVGKGWQPSSTCDNSDAMATGEFCDSVELVDFKTGFRQTEHSVRQRFQEQISWLAIECGYHSYQVVTINECDYYAFQRKYAEARLEAMGVTRRAIEAMKAGNSQVFDKIAIDCPSDELVEFIEVMNQLKANKGAKHD